MTLHSDAWLGDDKILQIASSLRQFYQLSICYLKVLHLTYTGCMLFDCIAFFTIYDC